MKNEQQTVTDANARTTHSNQSMEPSSFLSSSEMSDFPSWLRGDAPKSSADSANSSSNDAASGCAFVDTSSFSIAALSCTHTTESIKIYGIHERKQ